MLENIEWEACLLEPRHDPALMSDVRQQFGRAPPYVAYFASVPWLARAGVAFSTYPRLHVSEALTEMIGLVVAEDNSCRYCYAGQRALLRLQGFSLRRVRELEESRFGARLDARDVLALEFARHLSRADARLSEDRARLRSVGWSDDAIGEIACVAATSVFANRISTFPALPIVSIERIAQFPGLAIVAPLARRFLFLTRGDKTPLDRSQCVGPWSFLIESLARVPAGRSLRRMIDEACASPVLPRSSKLLVFAVIARAVRCARSEREAIRLLLETGITLETVGETLRHLHSSGLDAAQIAIVNFARETVRYRPAEIQRNTRALEQLLGEEAVVELIGIAALANAVCRLGVLVDAAA